MTVGRLEKVGANDAGMDAPPGELESIRRRFCKPSAPRPDYATIPNTPSCPDAETIAGEANKPKLSPSRSTALKQFLSACSQNAALVGATDREVYDWIRENCNVEDLPSFETWGRYLRDAKAAYGLSKNTSRNGRQRGRSIVRLDEI